MMVTHVDYPALDPDWPASLSRKVMGDLLRNRLHFDGIIMTDDLTMGAIAGSWPLEEAAVRALGAGADQVMVCPDPEAIRKVHKAIAAAIREGKLPKDQGGPVFVPNPENKGKPVTGQNMVYWAQYSE